MSEIKLLISDGDGTLWHYPNKFGSSWSALSIASGLEQEDEQLLGQYYDKPDLDEEWSKKLAVLFKGFSIKLAEERLFPIPYSSGVKEFFSIEKRLRKGLLTNGLDVVAEKAVGELGLDFCFCNVLHRNNGFFTGVLDYKVRLWQKHLLLEQVCQGIPFEQVAYIGDTKNDILCMKDVGLAIAFNPKDKEVVEVADYVINDFRELRGMLK